jgi:hypothetical protein
MEIINQAYKKKNHLNFIGENFTSMLNEIASMHE